MTQAMQTAKRDERAGKPLKLFLVDLGPVLVFYAVNHFYGLRAAVVTTIVFTCAEVARFRWKKEPTTKLFKFSVGMTLFFSALDLIFAQGLFVKLEPVVTNLITAGFFALTMWNPRSLLQEFAERQGKADIFDNPDRQFFFRVLTGVWVFYFAAKAAVYLRYNLSASIEEGLVFRTVVGNGSMFAMLGVSILGGKYLSRLLYRMGLMPSQRGAAPAKELNRPASRE